MINEKILETLTDDNGNPIQIKAYNVAEVELAISQAVALLRIDLAIRGLRNPA